MYDITKIYVDEDGVQHIDRDTAIEYLENRGYYKPGTVDMVIKAQENTQLRTPVAAYNFKFWEG